MSTKPKNFLVNKYYLVSYQNIPTDIVKITQNNKSFKRIELQLYYWYNYNRKEWFKYNSTVAIGTNYNDFEPQINYTRITEQKLTQLILLDFL